MYRSFIEAIDAVDNGVNPWEGDAPPRYTNSTDLSSRVGKLNPNWNEDSSEPELRRRFDLAVELAGKEFSDAVRYYATAWLPARALVLKDLDARAEVDASGEIMAMGSFCPWKEHLHALEAEQGIAGKVKYVLYEDDRENTWRVQAVATSPGGFASRLPLPAAWRGLRDAELSGVTGIEGCVFVHAAGFIGGNKTRAGALEMARKGLALGASA